MNIRDLAGKIVRMVQHRSEMKTTQYGIIVGLVEDEIANWQVEQMRMKDFPESSKPTSTMQIDIRFYDKDPERD